MRILDAIHYQIEMNNARGVCVLLMSLFSAYVMQISTNQWQSDFTEEERMTICANLLEGLGEDIDFECVKNISRDDDSDND